MYVKMQLPVKIRLNLSYAEGDHQKQRGLKEKVE